MRIWYFALLLLPCILSAKIYDCFPFFNEIELLKMRFEELNDVVDHFVLVESIETQRGTPKPLYFQENKHLFEKYLPKIIHVVVEEKHPELTFWHREYFQRNCIMRGLQKCCPTDIIVISDLDEIPRASTLDQVAIALQTGGPLSLEHPPLNSWKKKKRYKRYLGLKTYAFQMDHYNYQLNRQVLGEGAAKNAWYGTIVTAYGTLSKHTPQYFRSKRDKLPRIPKGGWHFSWMGGKEKVRQKLISIVEGRSDGDQIGDKEIEQWISGHPSIPIDDSFPNYIRKNLDHLKSLGFIAETRSE